MVNFFSSIRFYHLLTQRTRHKASYHSKRHASKMAPIFDVKQTILSCKVNWRNQWENPISCLLCVSWCAFDFFFFHLAIYCISFRFISILKKFMKSKCLWNVFSLYFFNFEQFSPTRGACRTAQFYCGWTARCFLDMPLSIKSGEIATNHLVSVEERNDFNKMENRFWNFYLYFCHFWIYSTIYGEMFRNACNFQEKKWRTNSYRRRSNEYQ